MFFTLLLFFSVKLYGMAAVNNINLRWDTRERAICEVGAKFFFIFFLFAYSPILFYFISSPILTTQFFFMWEIIKSMMTQIFQIWFEHDQKKLNLHKIHMSGCMTWFCVCYKTVIHPHLNSFFITHYTTHYKLIILN